MLRDLAKQEDENRVQYIKKVQSEEKIVNYVDENHFENPFKPVKEILVRFFRISQIIRHTP